MKHTLIIDASTDTVIDQITVGDTPRGLAFSPDGTKAYVANFFDNSISVISVDIAPQISSAPRPPLQVSPTPSR